MVISPAAHCRVRNDKWHWHCSRAMLEHKGTGSYGVGFVLLIILPVLKCLIQDIFPRPLMCLGIWNSCFWSVLLNYNRLSSHPHPLLIKVSIRSNLSSQFPLFLGLVAFMQPSLVSVIFPPMCKEENEWICRRRDHWLHVFSHVLSPRLFSLLPLVSSSTWPSCGP